MKHLSGRIMVWGGRFIHRFLLTFWVASLPAWSQGNACDPRAGEIDRKLDSIMIGKDDDSSIRSMEDCLKLFQDKSGGAVPFRMQGTSEAKGYFSTRSAGKTCSLKEALRHACLWNGYYYDIRRDGVVLIPKTDVFVTRTWNVSASFPVDFKEVLATRSDRADEPLSTLFKRAGIPFPDGSWVVYNSKTSSLTMRNKLCYLDQAEEVLATYKDFGKMDEGIDPFGG